MTACVWHPRQPHSDPVVTLRNDHKFVIQAFSPVIPDYFKGELMEQRGALLLVSWSLCGPAGGSFREKWLDRVAWRSSAATWLWGEGYLVELGCAGEHEANFAAFSRFAVISVFYTL